MKKGNIIVTLVMFFTILMAFCAFAIDFTIILTQRAKLQSSTEAAAISGCAHFRYDKNLSPESKEVRAATETTLKLLKDSKMEKVEVVSVEINDKSKAILLKTQGYAPTYFLNMLGIGTIKIKAQAACVSETKWLDPKQPKVFDKSRKNAYEGSIIVSADNERDTSILQPLSEVKNASVKSGLGLIDYALIYGAPDDKPLSFGAGGHVTLRLPAMLVDKPGNDLYVKEQGFAEGYYLYAGVDVIPDNPYLNRDYPGGGVKWVNISCTGMPENEGGAYSLRLDSLGAWQTKFYGSGYFDLGATCSAQDGYDADLKTAKYLKLVDDNEENAINKDDKPIFVLGESSTVTPGVDIDAVGVLNQAKLIKKSQFDSLPK